MRARWIFAVVCAVLVAGCGDDDGPSGSGDSSPPSVSLDEPGAGELLSGTVTLEATASDNVGVESVEFLLDGEVLGSDAEAPYTLSWNTLESDEGAHTLAARATDAAGLTTTTPDVEVGVGNTPGSIEITVEMVGGVTDADGFDVLVDGVSRGALAGAGSLTVSDVAPGSHGVSIGRLRPFCDTEIVEAVVPSGGTTTTEVVISCLPGAPGGWVLMRGTPVGGPFELVALSLESGSSTVLESQGHADAALSPDGTRLAMIEETTLYLADANGANATPLAVVLPTGASSPRWSPDGASIVFFAERGAVADLYIVDADGTDLRPVFAAASAHHRVEPSWSSTGRLAYSEVAGLLFDGVSAIWTADPDGSDAIQVTPDGLDRQPVWSPDGSEIVFARAATVGQPMRDLFAVAAAGGDARRLTNDAESESTPVWSPDGSWVAYHRDGPLWAVSAEGANLVPLSDGYDIIEPLDWRAGAAPAP